VRGRAWLVRRLDSPGGCYYLVELGTPGSALGAATVDAQSEAVGVFARLSGVGSHVTTDAALAIELAGGGESAGLVWTPCRVSKSPLYPFWEVKTRTGLRYVDLQGKVFEGISPTGPGG